MTYIAGIRLTNWLRYRGEHEAELGPTVYAVVAEWDHDPQRSNWGGKSALLWAVRFALSGKHPKRTDDEWITRGETEGGVDLEWSDGTFISRTKKIGKRTELRVLYPDGDGGELEAFGADAQAVIDERLGLTDADSTNTWWLEQHEMASFIKSDPAERTRVVSRWLVLGPLDDATKWVAERLRHLVEQDDRAAASEATLAQQLEALCHEQAIDDGDPLIVLAERARDAEQRRDAAGAEMRADQAKLAELQQWQAVERDAETYQILSDEVSALETELAGSAAPTPAELARLRRSADEAVAAVHAAQAEERGKLRLVRGQFEGTCPVGGIQCPVTAELNAQGERARQMHDDAEQALERARADHRLARDALDAAQGRATSADRLRTRIDEKRRQAERYRAAAEQLRHRPELPEADLDRVARAQSATRQAEADLVRARSAADQYQRLSQALATKRAERHALRAPVTTHREALALLRAARRRVAERAMGRIEEGANELLRESGIDLAMSVRWSREGRELATACTGCGTPFPSSRRVRECSTCGAVRGPKVDEKLHVVLTDESGGALDLAGVAAKLSAGAWLREQRDSTWSVACLDEPFGALDRAHSQALAAHIASMIRGRYGFEQAFVVAHDQVLLDSLPGRIVVRAGADGSRLEVA